MRPYGDTRLAAKQRGFSAFTVDECLSRLCATNGKPRTLDEDDRIWLVALVKARFYQRFITPIELLTAQENQKQTADEESVMRVGFTVLAISCLMIESLACFRCGQWTTGWTPANQPVDPAWGKNKADGLGKGWRSASDFTRNNRLYRGRYIDFLRRMQSDPSGKSLFPSRKQATRFYSGIRCGIMHQAETSGKWRSDFLKTETEIKWGHCPTIDAQRFFISLKKSFDDYMSRLADTSCSMNSSLWKAFRYKILGLCKAAGWPGKDTSDMPHDFGFYRR